MEAFLTYYLFIALLFAIACGVIAKGKNRDVVGWGILGLLLGPFGLIVGFLPTLPDPDSRPCPHCRSFISRHASVCPNCGKEVVPTNIVGAQIARKFGNLEDLMDSNANSPEARVVRVSRNHDEWQQVSGGPSSGASLLDEGERMMAAIEAGDMVTQEEIRARSIARLERVEEVGGTDLEYAVIKGDLGIVKDTYYLFGAESFKQVSDSLPYFAAKLGHIEILRFLLELGINPNNKRGMRELRPIHIAAENGHAEIVALLAESGADLDAPTPRSEGRNTALHLAAIGGHPDVWDALLRTGADVGIENAEGKTPEELLPESPGEAGAATDSAAITSAEEVSGSQCEHEGEKGDFCSKCGTKLLM